MAWVKVDDTFPDHPKALDLTLAAKGLWLEGLCYVNRQQTDGALPAAFLRRVGDDDARRSADELVAAGLWHATETGWAIHDYLDHQRSREQIATISATRSEAGKRGGVAKAKQIASNMLANGCQDDGKTEANLCQKRREEKRRDEEKTVVAGETPAPPARETQFQKGWQPDDALLAWAAGRGWPEPWVRDVTEEFTAYWLSRTTRRKDWGAAWRTWLLKESRTRPPRTTAASPASAPGRAVDWTDEASVFGPGGA